MMEIGLRGRTLLFRHTPDLSVEKPFEGQVQDTEDISENDECVTDPDDNDDSTNDEGDDCSGGICDEDLNIDVESGCNSDDSIDNRMDLLNSEIHNLTNSI